MKITIEGNIGCGKTTLCTSLADAFRLPVVLEPLNEWSTMLDRFYADPARWGFTFNANVLASYARWSASPQDAIFERSPMSCRYVFSQVQLADGHIDDVELGILDSIFRSACWTPDLVVYLRCPPSACFERVQSRGRACESEVPLGYLEKVHAMYESMVATLCPHAIVVDASRPAPDVLLEVRSRLQPIICAS